MSVVESDEAVMDARKTLRQYEVNLHSKIHPGNLTDVGASIEAKVADAVQMIAEARGFIAKMSRAEKELLWSEVRDLEEVIEEAERRGFSRTELKTWRSLHG